jgi:glycerol-3-phosphate dehydrogenase
MISNMIEEILGIDCAVLMGANLAPEVADEQFCEATIGNKFNLCSYCCISKLAMAKPIMT